MTHLNPTEPGKATGRRPTTVRRDAHRDYVRRRSLQIAYGKWEPWADAKPVRQHVHKLRRTGATYRAIACAAGVSPMMVHNLVNGHRTRAGQPPCRIGSAQARRIMAVTPAAITSPRRFACGSRHRLQALVALGHSPVSLARRLGISPLRLHRLLTSDTKTVSAALHASACDLYSRLWNQLPPEDSQHERSSAELARNVAKARGWPAPMALDDDKLDDPAYKPRAAWRHAAGNLGS